MNSLKVIQNYIPVNEIIPIINRTNIDKFFDLQRLKNNYKAYKDSGNDKITLIRVNQTLFCIDDVEKYIASRDGGFAVPSLIYDFWENRNLFSEKIPNFLNDIQNIYCITQIYKHHSVKYKWSVEQWSTFLQISNTQFYKVRQLANLHDETILWFAEEKMITDFALDVAKVVPMELQPRINKLVQEGNISIFEYFEVHKSLWNSETEE